MLAELASGLACVEVSRNLVGSRSCGSVAFTWCSAVASGHAGGSARCAARGPLDDQRRVVGQLQWLAHEREAGGVLASKVDDHDAVLPSVDQQFEAGLHLDQLDLGQVADEDGVLHAVAEAFGAAGDQLEAALVSDV